MKILRPFHQPLRLLPGSLVAGWLLFSILVPHGVGAETTLDRAQRHLEAGQPEQALALVEKAARRDQGNGRALLIRSTARFMLGQVDTATADLRRALEIDPGLRQGWLNLAGVEIAAQRYDAAHDALSQAERLEPEAPDNDLNLGAVLLMRGQQAEATQRLERYLAAHDASAEAHFQVAGNYALAAAVGPMVDVLRRAFALDERLRMRARADGRFEFFHDPRFRQLMNTDSYQLPADAHQVAAAFRHRYDRQDTVLVHAVTAALTQNQVTYDRTIEATDAWALIWGDGLRVKISNQGDGNGTVRLSASSDQFTQEDWHRLSQAIFRSVQEQLARQVP